ncbi:MAG: YfiR family protein [Breznakibacter sp.]
MKRFILLIALVLAVAHSQGQNYKFQALYLFNIVQHIEWPSVESTFKIGVVGCEEIEKELSSIVRTRKICGLPVTVTSYLSETDGIADCQMVYLSRTVSSKLANVQAVINNRQVLLVTDKVGLRGAGINMIDISTKLEFEVYPSIIKSHGLKLSNSLLNLGIVKQ